MVSISTGEKKGKGYLGCGKWAKFCLNYLSMHCFGKTEVVILVQLDFISLIYVLFLNYFSHFTRLMLRESITFTGFSFGRHMIKVSFTSQCCYLPLLMVAFFPCISLTHTSFDTLALRLLWPDALLGSNWNALVVYTDIVGGLCCMGDVMTGTKFPQGSLVLIEASFSSSLT